MRILVFSDSHGRRRNMEEALFLHPEAEAVIFLGDGERDFRELRELFQGPRFFGVRGNCDFGSSEQGADLITEAGKRIFFTHGHLFGVKEGLWQLEEAAGRHRADIALFGHTHIAYTAFRDGIYYMNPGSIGSGAASYGLLDITPSGVLMNTAQLP